VRVANGFVLGATAAEMLTRACDWLLTRGDSSHGYIDLSSAHDGWVC
jgi:hypothetical protein